MDPCWASSRDYPQPRWHKGMCYSYAWATWVYM